MNDFEDNATVEDTDKLNKPQLLPNIAIPIPENKGHLCDADYSLHPDIKEGYIIT